MPRFTRASLVGGILLLAAACSSVPRSGAPRERNVIHADEIEPLRVASALEVIQTLRPQFLRTRGTSSIVKGEPDYPVVYIDGMFAGDLSNLRRIATHQIGEIRYLSGPDATTRFGTGHPGGAILIRTRS